jgi:hypothetical protein
MPFVVDEGRSRWKYPIRSSYGYRLEAVARVAEAAGG